MTLTPVSVHDSQLLL